MSLILTLEVLERVFSRDTLPGASSQDLLKRRGLNLILGVLGVMVQKSFVPAGLALWAEYLKHPLFTVKVLSVSDNSIIELIRGLLVLDLAIYWQHRLFHRFNILWIFHRTHHQDQLLDWTSGIRFHPVEILLSLFWKMLVIYLLGINGNAVLVYSFILSAHSLFQHGNFRIPSSFDSMLRCFIVTPSYHRTHHVLNSTGPNSRFASFLVIWDYLFGTLGDEDFENLELGVLSSNS